MLAVPSPGCPSLRYVGPAKPGLALPTQLLSCALLLAFTSPPLHAQGGQGLSGNSTVGWPGAGDLRMRELEDLANEMYERQSQAPPATQAAAVTCTLQPYPGPSNTVSLRSLQVPDKVQNEHQKACTALRSENLAESEKHLRKALQLYSPDALGWVMLAKVLEANQRWDEASRACSEAIVHDPSYWPAVLCIAEIDAREQKWTESLELSNRALSLNVDSKRFAYYLSAIALVNLDKVGDAESRALEAERLDSDHQLPPLRLVLARIDEVKGDRPGAVTQLRECFKYAKNSPAGDLAKQELSRLGSEPN